MKVAITILIILLIIIILYSIKLLIDRSNRKLMSVFINSRGSKKITINKK